jgi:HNH endonuclease
MPQTDHKEIVEYWEVRQDECGLSVDWAEAHERCWRCGYKTALHRCHIIPAALGGPDEPSNLVLLCERCHREAPNVVDPEFMWQWLRAHGVPFYDSYWTLRGILEYEKIFGRKPFANAQTGALTDEVLLTLLRPLFGKVVTHFGEGRLNPSTIAWCLREAERQYELDPK